jgi:hypothetical protein
LKRYKATGSDQVPAELTQAGEGGTLRYITYADLEQRRIVSPVERVDCCTYSPKRVIKLTAVITVNFIQNFI